MSTASSNAPVYGVHSESAPCARSWSAPGLGHLRLTPSNNDDLLFDDVLWVDKAKRDHLDFVASMRSRGIEVVEMHEWLAETVAIPAARDWLLDRQDRAQQRGPGLLESTRAYLESLPPAALAEYLIGGLSVVDLPDEYCTSGYLSLVREAHGVHEYLLPPLPNTLYTRDTTCWIYGGVTLNPLYWPVRREETLLTTAIYRFHRASPTRTSRCGWATRTRTSAGNRRGRRRHAGRQRRGAHRHERADLAPGASASSRPRCSRRARRSG